MRVRRSVLLALCATLTLAGCKKNSGTSDGGTDAADDACDLSNETRFDAGPPIPVVANPTLPNFFDVWGTAPNDIWAVGSAGLIMHWDGTSWTGVEAPVVGDLLGINGTPADDTHPVEMFAVGLGGAILHYDGTVWTQQQTPFNDGGMPMTADLHAVSSGAKGTAKAVGIDALLIETVDSGATWTMTPVPTQETLNGIWVAPGNSGAVAVGNLGTILVFDGSAWSRQRLAGLTAHLKGVWGWGMGNVFATGLNGTLITNQGESGGGWRNVGWPAYEPRDIACQQLSTPWPNVYLRDAWGDDGAGYLTVVGWDGTITRMGNGIATVYSVTEQRLEAIWGIRVIDTPGQGDGGIPDAGLEYHYEATIVGVSGAVIRVWMNGNP